MGDGSIVAIVPPVRLFTTVLYVLLPAVCPACGEGVDGELCAACHERLPLITNPCPRCAAPRRDEEASCTDCLDRGLAHVRMVVCAWLYRDGMRKLIGEAKTLGRSSAVRACCTLLPDLSGLPPLSAVIPIPPSPGRRTGPHLATALATAAARRVRAPLITPLRVTRAAAAQHELGEAERQRNVRELFVCRKKLAGVVLLVDDLTTSGATLSAGAAALVKAGATGVLALTLARTAARSG